MKEKKEESRKYNIKKNCYMCVNYMHSYYQSEENPLLIQPADYCHDKGKNVALPDDFFYKEHDCCVLYPMRVAEFDEELQHEQNLSKIKEIVQKKYL